MVGSVADLGEGPGGVRVVVRLVYVSLLLLLSHVVLLLVRHKGRSVLLLLAVVDVDWLLNGNHLLERRRRHGSSLVLVVPVWLIERKNSLCPVNNCENRFLPVWGTAACGLSGISLRTSSDQSLMLGAFFQSSEACR